MKEDQYTKSLANNQVCAIFQIPDIRKNGLPKLNKALYGNAMLVSQYGRRIPTETSVFEFSY